MITGLNGRAYDSSGKRVEAVPHPETRTPSEVRRARMAKQPGQPSGNVDGINPFERTIDIELKRHNHNWARSDEGKRVLGNLKRASKEWEAEQERNQEAEKFAESVRPAVEHAQRTLATAHADATVTVEELETLTANVELARQGKLEEYSAADKEWRQTQANKILAQAVEVDSQARTLTAQRDVLLQAAYEPLKGSEEPVYGDVYYPENYIDPTKAGKTIREIIPQ